MTAMGTPAATFSAATGGTTHRFTNAGGLTNIALSVTKSEAVQTIRWGTSTATGTNPAAWTDFTGSGTSVTATITGTQPSGTWIGIQVTAASGDVYVYKFRVAYGDSTATISAVTIAGKEPNSLGTPGTAYNTGVTVANIYLTSAQVTAGRQILVTTANPVSRIRVGTSTSNNTAPTNYATLATASTTAPYIWTGTIPGNALANNSTRIALEITSEDATTLAFYKFLVMTANNAVLTSLSVGGVATTAAQRGTPAGSWNTPNLVTGTALTLTGTAATGAAITQAGTNPGTITYAVTQDLTTEPVFAAAPVGGFNFTTGDYLYVQLAYTTGGNTYRNIYRIPITVSP
jgi:hypothetical protein